MYVLYNTMQEHLCTRETGNFGTPPSIIQPSPGEIQRISKMSDVSLRYNHSVLCA